MTELSIVSDLNNQELVPMSEEELLGFVTQYYLLQENRNCMNGYLETSSDTFIVVVGTINPASKAETREEYLEFMASMNAGDDKRILFGRWSHKKIENFAEMLKLFASYQTGGASMALIHFLAGKGNPHKLVAVIDLDNDSKYLISRDVLKQLGIESDQHLLSGPADNSEATDLSTAAM